MREMMRISKDEGFSNGTSASLDPCFRSIKRSSTNFIIWRIENMTLVPLPKSQHGIFYTNDSYVIYAATQFGSPSGTEAVTREIRDGPLEYHIHFWLGFETTPDKSGVAAYKTVELDGHLGGSAVQHRETQGNESARFKSYFKNGFRVLKGGSELGFSHATPYLQPKLYKIKGRQTPIITEEERISWNLFNSGDVFIILTPNIIFVWIGRAANGVEKLQAAKVAVTLKTEHDVPNVAFVDDGYEKTLSDEQKKEFDKYLPLDKRVVLPPDRGGLDEEAEKQHGSNIRLYCCSDNIGKYRVTEVRSGPLKQTDLNSEDVYILDNGLNGIWVWVGKKASEKERTEALRNARGFVKKKNYPNNTRVTRIVDGAEPFEFKILFLNWKEKSDFKLHCKTYPSVKIGKVITSNIDALTLIERPILAAESQLVDDGSGTLQMWKVAQNSTIEVPRKKYGAFFSGHCYIILYAYEAPHLTYIIYYWLGSEAQDQEKVWTTKKASEINKEFDGQTVQVRVIQGHEPPHFLQIFDGKMTTFKGKSNEYEENRRNAKEASHYLLQIIGSSTYSAKAIQVQCKAQSLNSNYCYVLRKNKQYYIWCGSYSTGDQREVAKGFVGKDFEILLEGKESPDFWKLLDAKKEYNTQKAVEENGNVRLPLLYHCSCIAGNIKLEEVLNFTQNDLIPEDIMLLDAYSTIFIWLGSLSTKDHNLSLDIAKYYLKHDPAGRNLNTPITELRQNYEPPIFTGFFPTWDDSLWSNTHKSFESFRNEIEGSNCNQSIQTRIAITRKDDNFDQYDKYPINILRETSDKLPIKVDALRKEMHLTHDDFVSLFKMNYPEFASLPKWKKQEMKKSVGLF